MCRRYVHLGLLACVVAAAVLLVPAARGAPGGAAAWLVIALCAVALVDVARVARRSIRRLKRQKRLLDLHCPHCAFDISAQFRDRVDRCPECGGSVGLRDFHHSGR